MTFKGTGRSAVYKSSQGRVPSVTTILGKFTEPGGLIHWAFKNGQAHPEWSNPYEAGEAQAGTTVHLMVEKWIHKEDPNGALMLLDNDPALQAQAKRCFENFLEWWDMSGLRISATEVPMVSEELGIGGTVDAVALDKQDRVAIIDWTTSNGLYADKIIQTATYGILWEETHPGVKIDGGYHICRYPRENPDFHHHHFGELDEAQELMRLLRQCYDLKKSVEKRT